MITIDSNISECPSIKIPLEHSSLKPKKERTLRRDLSHDGPREFRHISRLNSEVSTTTSETQQSSGPPNFHRDIIDDIHQYFSGLNSLYLNSSIKPPKVSITRRLTTNDITYPVNFQHVAHIDYHQVHKNIENMSEFDGKRSSDSTLSVNPKDNLTKEDISNPSEFRHVAHVSFGDNQLRMNTEDAAMKFSLEKVNTGDLQDKDIKKIFTGLIHNSGEKENENGNAPKKIRKEDIGYPENFQHLVHVDFQDNYPPAKILEKSLLNNVDKKDKEIRSFISEMVDTNQVEEIPPIPKPRTIKKLQIENPQDFRHNAHVSCKKTTTAEDNDILKSFFKKAGVTEEHLLDKETRKFVFDFVRHYSKFGDNKSNQQKPIPQNYRSLAEKIRSETDEKSHAEYVEILLAMYSRNFPL